MIITRIIFISFILSSACLASADEDCLPGSFFEMYQDQKTFNYISACRKTIDGKKVNHGKVTYFDDKGKISSLAEFRNGTEITSYNVKEEFSKIKSEIEQIFVRIYADVFMISGAYMPGPAIDGRIAQVAGACLPTAMGVVNFYISETPVKMNFAGACAFEGEMVLEIDKKKQVNLVVKNVNSLSKLTFDLEIKKASENKFKVYDYFITNGVAETSYGTIKFELSVNYKIDIEEYKKSFYSKGIFLKDKLVVKEYASFPVEELLFK